MAAGTRRAAHSRAQPHVRSFRRWAAVRSKVNPRDREELAAALDGAGLVINATSFGMVRTRTSISTCAGA
jgi:hypothetical protein